MLFIESYISQSIFLSIAHAAQMYNKPNAAVYVVLRMIEVSPFLFTELHLEACFVVLNCISVMEKGF